MKKKTTANKPSLKLKAGPISVTVWKNEEFPTVIFERSYKDSNGKWVSTTRFSIHDLPVLAWLAERAFNKFQDN